MLVWEGNLSKELNEFEMIRREEEESIEVVIISDLYQL